MERLRNETPVVRAPEPGAFLSPSQTERAIAAARKAISHELIKIGIEIEDQEFDFSRMSGVGDAERAEVIEERYAQLRPSQDAIVTRVENLGGEELSRDFLANVVDVRVPAEHVPAIASWPSVKSISVPEPVQPESSDDWNGSQIRKAIQTHRFIKAGYHGNLNSHTDSSRPQRIAILESNTSDNDLILRHHVGWKDTKAADSDSRVTKVYHCLSEGGCYETEDTGSGNSHGNVVAWIAAGSIEQGQDPNYTRKGAQRARSGIAKEAEIMYYLFTGYDLDEATSALREAINQAVADGADIINMSFGVGEDYRCDQVDTATFDVDHLNSTLAKALAAGALPVKSAGNSGHSEGRGNTCTASYPAWRPHVLSVGALNNRSDNTNMNTTEMYSLSSRGGATIRYRDSTHSYKTAAIGLVAPSGVRNFFCEEPAGYCDYLCHWIDDPLSGDCEDVQATSFAAPVVSGAAALLRDAFNALNWCGGLNDARALMVNMLLLGDTWQGDGYDPYYGTDGYDMHIGVSEVSGYGRLHAHWPSDDNLTAPWGWDWRKEHLEQFECAAWPVGDWGPESMDVQQWKWAVTTFEQDMANLSAVLIAVKDSCNNNDIIAQDFSADFRKRIHLQNLPNWDWYIGGKCLVMQACAFVAPSDGVWLYSADYFHSGSPAQH